MTRQSCWQSTALTLPEHNLRGDDDSDEDNNSYGDDGDGDGNDDQCKKYKKTLLLPDPQTCVSHIAVS